MKVLPNSYPVKEEQHRNKSNQQNSGMINENSRVPFGKTHKGKKLGECPTTFLEWMVEHLWDSDLHAWAYAAKKLLFERRKTSKDDLKWANLEKSADDFLKAHGFSKSGSPIKHKM